MTSAAPAAVIDVNNRTQESDKLADAYGCGAYKDIKSQYVLRRFLCKDTHAVSYAVSSPTSVDHSEELL